MTSGRAWSTSIAPRARKRRIVFIGSVFLGFQVFWFVVLVLRSGRRLDSPPASSPTRMVSQFGVVGVGYQYAARSMLHSTAALLASLGLRRKSRIGSARALPSHMANCPRRWWRAIA